MGKVFEKLKPVPLYHHPEKKESLKMTSMMIRSTVAAGKGQLLKASTRAVPLGTVADHSAPPNVGTSIAVAQGVCEAKGHNSHWPNGDLEKQDGHVIYHDHVKGTYELLVVRKPKAIGTTSFAMSKALSSAGVPSAISGIGVTSQFTSDVFVVVDRRQCISKELAHWHVGLCHGVNINAN